MENVKDDLKMFIALQKQKLSEEKKELGQLKSSHNSPRADIQHNENHQTTRKSHYESSNNESDGLPIGDYEKKQRKLKEERIKDYKEYAAKQEFRRTGRRINDENNSLRFTSEKDFSNRQAFIENRDVTTPDIVDAYAELLRKKRAEERSYREHFDDLSIAPNRKVQFRNQNAQESQETFDDEDALFEWAREKAKITKRQSSAGTSRDEIQKIDIENENKRAQSVPPNVTAGIFGGVESTSALKIKKEKYKHDLEQQIKEKEEQKLKEKLRRMGRLSSQGDPQTSDDQLDKDRREKERKTTQSIDLSPRNRRQRTPDRSNRQRQPRKQYGDDDDEEVMQPQHNEISGYRGELPYRGMPMYDPRMQFMPNRYEMMDPYFMQRDFYGGLHGGPRGMMFAANPAIMNQMQGYNHFDLKDDRLNDDRKKTPRRTPSAKQDGGNDKIDESKRSTMQNISPRDTKIFGQNEETNDDDRRRAAKIAYQQELKKQMQEKQEAKEKEKRERERYDAKIEAEIAIYDPWGKAGAGAPVKDQHGKIVADLRTMHKQKDDDQMIMSPRNETLINDDLLKDMTSLQKDSPVLAAFDNLSSQQQGFQESPTNLVNISPRGQLQNNPTQRGAALREIQGYSQTKYQKSDQLEYQEYLKQQIEEKKRIKLEQERKEKEEEEKENRRLEEQRLKLERDFLEEQGRERRKEEETRQKNDEMRKAAEQKKQEAQKINKEIQQDRINILPKSSSELQTETMVIENRSSSPPIPTIAKQQNQEKRQQHPTFMESHNTRTDYIRKHEYESSIDQYNVNQQQSIIQHHTKVKTEENASPDMNYLSSIREQLYERNRGENISTDQNTNQEINSSGETHIIKQLAALRRQLSHEEKKVKIELQMNMGKYEESKTKPVPKKTKARNMKIFEKARIRKSSFSKKPPIKVADEFNMLTDASSVLDFKAKFPSQPVTSSDLDLQQREFIRLQEQKLQALRQAISETSNNLMLDIDNGKSSTSKQRRASKQSLLESESKFINLQDEIHDQNDGTVSRKSSARSRQKWKIQQQEEEEEVENSYLKKPKSPGGYSIGSMTSQAIEDLAAKNEARLRGLRGKDFPNENLLEDPEDVIDQYMKDSSTGQNRSASRRYSEKSLPSSTALQS